MAIYQFKREQLIEAPLPEVWDFISSPANLKEITPDYMGFDIVSEDLPEKMYPGMMVLYTVKPLAGIPLTWATEITHVREFEYFVDEQRAGPYSIWHHEHFVHETSEGTLMKDIVTYKPPLGFIGDMANYLVIRSKLKEIFDYRHKVLNRLFNESRATVGQG